jgi:hypothetical protein
MIPIFHLTNLDMRMATDDDQHLPAYDHTTLSNVNVCPTWGILRYVHHLRMPGAARAMALEAGSAGHEGFAAVKWFQFHNTQVSSKCEGEIAERHGIRLFGEERFRGMKEVLSNGATDRTNVINFTLEALYSCGFYDDPSDRNRTVSNISEGLIAYIDRYNMLRYPIWVRDNTSPDSDIGIEIPFDTVLTIQYTTNVNGVEVEHEFKSRFIGKLDSLHWDAESLLAMEEKTGARLDDSWLAQWILSHQITGYCLAAGTFTALPCNNAMVSGMRIPIGKIPSEGIRKEAVPRRTLMYEKWAEWFIHTTDIIDMYKSDVVKAPMYTHSCNRYFRPCSFVPFCASETEEEKRDMMEEMEIDDWSPLND